MASTSDAKAAVGKLSSFTSDPSLAPFTTSMAAYLAANAGFEGLATGALVFSSFSSTTSSSSSSAPSSAATTHNSDHDKLQEEEEDRILLVQRAPHDSMPLRWEVPGGACDDEDETVLHAVARELWEESGLRAAHVGPQVGEGRPFFTSRGRRMLKVEFLADVEGGESGEVKKGAGADGKTSPPVVKLDPEEHVAFLWATEEECRGHRVGETEITFTHNEQEQSILEGFRLRRELRAHVVS
ncbi:NUDIX hydrolase domain-like protein [Apiospora marii]|uniref:NUDIX hydrolase domain-like protein n=1 Tax=Apiospora marii TaxID=335849 RepID=A0ABR1R273_9PEZI